MKYVKQLGLLVVAVAALMAFTGAASASTLTSPAGTTYTSTFKATSTNTSFHGSFVTVSCGHSSLEGKIESHGANEASGNLTNVSFSECNYPTTITKKGRIGFNILWIFWSSYEFHIHTSVGECAYSSSGTNIGSFTGSNSSNAVIDINSAKLPRTGGSFFCGSSGTWTGSYTVTTPGSLFVD